MPAQIEKYSSTIQSNFRRTSPTITFDESFLPAAGKEFGADDFCEPRLPLTSGPVPDADKQAFIAEKINTDLRPAMSSYGGVTQPPPQIPAGFLFYRSLRRTKPAGQLERISARPVGRE
jgi:hypothetical protein